MSSKVASLMLLLLLAGGGYYYYDHFYRPAHEAAGASAQPDMMHMVMPVGVAEVIERDVQQWHEYSGRLTAVDYVEIRSRVSGPIETVNFKDGAIVQKGDLLFTIDPRPYAAEVARAEAALASAKAARNLSETQFKRAQSLIKDKAVSQSDYDTRKNEFNETAAQVQSAEAGLETAKLNLDYTQIKSPITGRVSRAEITAGNLVQAGASSPLLTTVVSQNPIYADFDIDEGAYLKVAPETSGDVSKIEVTLQLANDGKEHKGTVQSFDNRLNPQTGTLRARAVFNNDEGDLIPGLFARIRLGSAGMTKAILITDRAIGTDQSKKFVYVVGADNKVEYREVKPGDAVGGLRIIAEGLKPGEKIIVDGLQRAHPGGEVKPEMVGMESLDSAGTEPAAPASPAPEKKDPSGEAPKQPDDVQGNDKK
jgi:multidrug efflux system membrane fusion protein